MATESRTPRTTATRVATVLAALLAAPMLFSTASSEPSHEASRPDVVSAEQDELDSDELDLVGNAGRVPDSEKPKLTAYFERESYRPGESARLVLTDTAARVSLQVYRAGGETGPTLPHDVMLGAPVTRAARIGSVHGRRVVPIKIGSWPSGVYFVRLTAP